MPPKSAFSQPARAGAFEARPVVVIRLLAGVVRPGRETAFLTAIQRDLSRLERAPGLRRTRIGKRKNGNGQLTEFLWLTEWDEMGDVVAALGDPEAAPDFITDHSDLVASWSIRHFDVVDGGEWEDAFAISPSAGAEFAGFPWERTGRDE